ncbi:Sua5 YciO YrdC YwlC family protein [Nitratifractor sp.]
MIESQVFFTDTDTVPGFVSQNRKQLDRIKGRSPVKPYIRALPTLCALRTFERIPPRWRSLVRRARQTTFVAPSRRSFRVIRHRRHLLLIERLGWAYTTSANPAGAPFDPDFAAANADVTVLPVRGDGTPSRIYRLGRKRLRKLR